MKHIVFISHVPFIDKIPSLKNLINYLANYYDITIITTKDPKYPPATFFKDNIEQIFINQRRNKLGLPTSIKLIYSLLLTNIKKRPKYFFACDSISNYLLYIINIICGIKYINFLLEFPDIKDNKERKSIEKAKFIITHDKWHGNFLLQHYKIDKGILLFLPNSTQSPTFHSKTFFLHKELHICFNKTIILHSGGIGKWFNCKEIARSAQNWPKNYILVFHTSHYVEGDIYYKEITELVAPYNSQVLFNTTPVPDTLLDELVASAYIGLAIYNKQILDYRAEFMGLASGKIGNYLKCGVPVIATRVSSLSYLEEYHCGVLIDNEEDIERAIEHIKKDYDQYSINCYKCYNELWEASTYLNIIKEKIEEQ